MNMISFDLTDVMQAEYLTDIAVENGLSPDDYAKNIVTGWIQHQINGIYAAKVKAMTNAERKQKIGKIKEKKNGMANQ